MNIKTDGNIFVFICVDLVPQEFYNPTFDLSVQLRSYVTSKASRTAEVRRKLRNLPAMRACESVVYLRRDKVKLSLTSEQGKEAIVGILDAGDFFGEGCLFGQPLRIATPIAVSNFEQTCVPNRTDTQHPSIVKVQELRSAVTRSKKGTDLVQFLI